MSVIGALASPAGSVIFAVSEEVVRTLGNWKWDVSARYATHQRHNNYALTEFTGVNPDTISFEIQLLAQNHVEPIQEVWKIMRFIRTGQSFSLCIGDHAYGRYRWNILSISNKIEHTDVHGNLYAVTATLKLQEFLKS